MKQSLFLSTILSVKNKRKKGEAFNKRRFSFFRQNNSLIVTPIFTKRKENRVDIWFAQEMFSVVANSKDEENKSYSREHYSDG